MEDIKRQIVYVLMLDHEMQILQHCLGVFTTFEKLIEAKELVKAPTTLYETYFEYTDDYPPVKNEFAIVETVIIGEQTAVVRATNLDGYYDGPRQMTFVDPDTEFVMAYLDCVDNNSDELNAAFAESPEDIEPKLDLEESDMDELRALLSVLT